MKTAVIECQYFGDLSFWAAFMHYDQLLIEQFEHYQKRSFRNRCLIAAANGKSTLSIPLLKGKNNQTSIKDVEISYAENWQKIHWVSIRSAYGSAPFFPYYESELAELFSKKTKSLFEWNLMTLSLIKRLIGMNKPFLFTDKYLESDADIMDLRNGFTPKKRMKLDQLLDPNYSQVFEGRHGFIPHLNMLDLLFCTGPESPLILQRMFNI